MRTETLDWINLRNVSKRFGPRLVFEDVSFTVRRGDSLCLWGPNGSGKSTLLKIAAGLLRPTKGEVAYSLNEKERPPGENRDSIGMAAPDVLLYGELTLAENLGFLARSMGTPSDADYENELIGRLFPGGLRDEPLETYSSGMACKAQLVAALARRPSVLLLDEPTSRVDETGRRAIGEILHFLKDSVILIMASNDPMERAWCAETFELRI